jgi:GNAT superfamily N-acetyltransferase
LPPSDTPPVTQNELNAGQPTGVRMSTDCADVDLEWLAPALSERAYWALGRSREAVEAALARSLCFSAFQHDHQVGFARVITDLVTFAWVCDVFVDETARGQGIGTLLIRTIADDPRLRDLRRIVLATRDAHEVYARAGFGPLVHPERWMERRRDSGGIVGSIR